MEPSVKRARLSDEDVDDGPSPLSLFDLSLMAMNENAKKGVHPIEVHKLSPLITDQIWKKSSILDIMENLCNPGTFELYSNRVIKTPSFTVSTYKPRFRGEELRQDCDLYIKFDDGRTLTWSLMSSSPGLVFPYSQFPTQQFQVGDQAIVAKLFLSTKEHLSLHSDITHSWISRFRIIEWLTKAFHCEIESIQLLDDFKHFHDLLNWDRLITVPSLVIKQCDYPELLETLLPERLERKLTTRVYTLNCPQPVRFRLTRSLQFFYIHMDLASVRLHELTYYLGKALKLCLNGVEFIIPKFNTRQVQMLKTGGTGGNSSDNINSLRENYEICSSSKEIFKTSEPTFYCVKNNSKAFVYYFLEETPGVYNRLLGHYWTLKHQRAQ